MAFKVDRFSLVRSACMGTKEGCPFILEAIESKPRGGIIHAEHDIGQGSGSWALRAVTSDQAGLTDLLV